MRTVKDFAVWEHLKSLAVFFFGFCGSKAVEIYNLITADRKQYFAHHTKQLCHDSGQFTELFRTSKRTTVRIRHDLRKATSELTKRLSASCYYLM